MPVPQSQILENELIEQLKGADCGLKFDHGYHVEHQTFKLLDAEGQTRSVEAKYGICGLDKKRNEVTYALVRQ